MSHRNMNSKKGQSTTPPVANDLFEKKWVQILLFVLIPAAIFLLISAGIRVSQYGIDHTIVVLGQRKLVANSQAAMRVTLIDDSQGFFLPKRLDAFLVMKKKRFPLFTGEVLDSGYTVARNYHVPNIFAGLGILELHVFFDDKKRIIKEPIEIVKNSPKTSLQFPSDTKPNTIVAKINHQNQFLRIFPEGRGAPSGLSSLLFVLATDDQEKPISTQYRFELPSFSKTQKKKIVTGKTNSAGLNAFAIKPLDLHYPICVLSKQPSFPNQEAPTVSQSGSIQKDTSHTAPKSLLDTDSLCDTDSTSTLTNNISIPPPTFIPPVVYSGMKIDFDSPIVENGKDIVLHIEQISHGEPVYIEIFKENQWLYTTSGWIDNEGKATIRFKPPATGILRIQATNSVLHFNRNVAVRHIYAAGPNESERHILQTIASSTPNPIIQKWFSHILKTWDAPNTPTSKTQLNSNLQLTAAFSLSRLYQGHSPLPKLSSSRKSDDKELNEFKSKFQFGLMTAILLLGLSVAIIIAIIAWQSNRRQNRLAKIIMDDSVNLNDSDDPIDKLTSQAAKTTRTTQWIQIGTLFLVILAAFAAIALLVVTMSWG